MTISHFTARGVAVLILLSVFVLATATSHSADTDFFSRHELYLDGPIDDLLIGDADGDGLQDIFVFYRQPSPGTPTYRVTFFRQDRRDRFSNTNKQSWPLPDNGGLFDLADVTGDGRPELVALTRQGVMYYPMVGRRFDTVLEPLISPAESPYIPLGTVRTWDFCWPLITGKPEIVALPRQDYLELWSQSDRGVYLPADSLWCPSIIYPPLTQSFRPENMGYGLSGMSYSLPAPAPRLTELSLDLFLVSTVGVKHFQRNELTGLGFTAGARLMAGNSSAPFFADGPFDSKVCIDDISGDGSPDLIRCFSRGGVTKAKTELAIYYGPLSVNTKLTPNRRLTVENVMAYPQLVDLDGDRRKEIVLCAVELGTITSAKMIVVKSASVYLLAYRQKPDNSFGPDPDERLKLSCRLNTETPGLLGRVPVRFVDDFDLDGRPDFVVCPGRDELQIYLSRKGHLLPKEKTLTIDCDAPAAVYSADLDQNRKSDLIVLHHTKPDHVHKVTVFLTQ